jgi:hypothetical protein
MVETPPAPPMAVALPVTEVDASATGIDIAVAAPPAPGAPVSVAPPAPPVAIAATLRSLAPLSS